MTTTIKRTSEKRLTKSEKRVLVAKDVLKHLKSKKFMATSGSYVYYSDSPYLLNMDMDSQVCDFLNGQKECVVCAMGALFAAQVMRFDNLTIRDITKNSYSPQYAINESICDEQFTDYLSKLFTPIQFRLIEAAFEQTVNYFHKAFAKVPYGDYYKDKVIFGNLSSSIKNSVFKAVDFGRKYGNSKARMIAIMKNIIKNKGTFKP